MSGEVQSAQAHSPFALVAEGVIVNVQGAETCPDDEWEAYLQRTKSPNRLFDVLSAVPKRP